MTVIIIKSKILVIKETKENFKKDIQSGKMGKNKIIPIIIGSVIALIFLCTYFQPDLLFLKTFLIP
jgi:hypothetical protein